MNSSWFSLAASLSFSMDFSRESDIELKVSESSASSRTPRTETRCLKSPAAIDRTFSTSSSSGCASIRAAKNATSAAKAREKTARRSDAFWVCATDA